MPKAMAEPPGGVAEQGGERLSRRPNAQGDHTMTEPRRPVDVGSAAAEQHRKSQPKNPQERARVNKV